MKVELEFDRYGMGDEEIARFIGELVETMVNRNKQYLHHYPRLSLLDAGVRYKESHGAWRDIPHVLKARSGDCKDIVPWRIAELRMWGESAVVQVIVLDSARLFHLRVLREGGQVEDTSEILGMTPMM